MRTICWPCSGLFSGNESNEASDHGCISLPEGSSPLAQKRIVTGTGVETRRPRQEMRAAKREGGMKRFVIFALIGPPVGASALIFIVIPLQAILDGSKIGHVLSETMPGFSLLSVAKTNMASV
jgi:hypothetical protein